MRIVIEKRIHHFLFWSTEADNEINIYHCDKCNNDYKQDDLDIERDNVRIANENKVINWLVRFKKITPEQAIERQKNHFITRNSHTYSGE
jgi:hypothetical protein